MRHYGPVALLMAGIVLVAGLLVCFAGTVPVPGQGEELTVVTTLYPLYTATLRVVGDVPGVTVTNLTGSATGCLHDYQLSPANRLLLERADLLILNGAGAEEFLEEVLPALPGLPVTDTSAKVSLLAGEHHHHEEEHAHEEHEEAYNEHIWVSPARYSQQVEAIAEGLCMADKENEDTYRANALAYKREIEDLENRLYKAVAHLPGKTVVTFHESLAYLAEDLGFEVLGSVSVGEDEGVSPASLAEIQRELTAHPDTLLLYDSQYTVRYPSLDSAVDSRQVLALNTAVLGDGSPDSWLQAMEENCRLFEQNTKEE